MLEQLIYISVAKRASPHDVNEILKSAHKNNPQLGITGVLVLVGNTFIQVLEGPKEAVSSLFEIISRDERHRDIQCLSQQPIEERAFSDWSMAYVEKTPSNIKTISQNYDATGKLETKVKDLAISHEWLGDFILDCQKSISN